MAHFIPLTHEERGLYYVNFDQVLYCCEALTGYTLIAFEEDQDPPVIVKETLGQIHRLLQQPRGRPEKE